MRYSLILVFLLTSSVVFAQDSVKTNCNDVQSQLALNECSAKDLVESENRLQDAYDLAIKKLDETNQTEKKDLFLKTQNIWEEYKNVNCDVQAGKQEESGSIWPYLVNSCNARMNNDRATEIKTTIYLEPSN